MAPVVGDRSRLPVAVCWRKRLRWETCECSDCPALLPLNFCPNCGSCIAWVQPCGTRQQAGDCAATFREEAAALELCKAPGSGLTNLGAPPARVSQSPRAARAAAAPELALRSGPGEVSGGAAPPHAPRGGRAAPSPGEGWRRRQWRAAPGRRSCAGGAGGGEAPARPRHPCASRSPAGDAAARRALSAGTRRPPAPLRPRRCRRRPGAAAAEPPAKWRRWRPAPCSRSGYRPLPRSGSARQRLRTRGGSSRMTVGSCSTSSPRLCVSDGCWRVSRPPPPRRTRPSRSRCRRMRLEKELDVLENRSSAASTRENLAEAAAPAREEKAEAVPNTEKSPLGTAKAERKVSSSPMKAVEGTDMMKAAMYSVEITVEKDRVTGETKVLSSSTLLPQEHCPQGVKVYEDELRVVHAVSAEDGALASGAQPLSCSEVDELLHKADEVVLSEAAAAQESAGAPGSQQPTPLREITGLQAVVRESPAAQGQGAEQPVTMIFMGYQNVEDEDETKKVLGLEGTIKAELVVIEDTESKVAPGAAGCKELAPPNGTALEPASAAAPLEQSPLGAGTACAKEAEQDTDAKKQRCKCCTVM